MQNCFGGESIYTTVEDDLHDDDWTPDRMGGDVGDVDVDVKDEHKSKSKFSCSSKSLLIGALVVVVLLGLFYVALTDSLGFTKAKYDELLNKFKSTEKFNSPGESDLRARVEVHGSLNNVARDPAVQKVVGEYGDFKSANNPSTPLASQGRKGKNGSDAGGNRFAASESQANQEGSLWTKTSGGVERMASKNAWAGPFSEAGLDPHNMYSVDMTVGQPMYDWGPSPARGPRGKTDLLLGAASAGF
jgi:hypothetical protein